MPFWHKKMCSLQNFPIVTFLMQFLLTFFLRVSKDLEYRTTYVTLNLTITAAMIIYGMMGFVQELKQTSKSNSILEIAQHFDSLAIHLKDENVRKRSSVADLSLIVSFVLFCRETLLLSVVMLKIFCICWSHNLRCLM